MVRSSQSGPRGLFLWSERVGHSSRKARRDVGQALVEFALILPVFLLLTLATLDFSRAYFTIHVLNNASREGARVGVLSGATSADVTNFINNQLNAAGLDAQASNVSVSGVDGAAPGDSTTVSVSFPFQTLTGSIIPGWTGTINLAQTTVMRHE